MNLSYEDLVMLKEYAAMYGRDDRIVAVEQAIINSQNANAAVNFARMLDVADLDALMPIFKYENGSILILNFASICGERGHDIKPLQDIITSYSDPSMIYKFAMIKGADVKALQDKLIELEAYDSLFRLAKNNSRADISAIEDFLDRKSTRLNSSHLPPSRMPSSA